MSRQRNVLDSGFEGLCTGMEMVEAVFDEYERRHPRQEPRVKDEHPGTFERSLGENEEKTKNK